MRFQRGPVLAYAAVVLVGLLVLVQTLSPDVSSLHRVPRTLAGQAEFTVVPPAPTPDVSGVDAIPGTGGERGESGENRSDRDDESATPGEPGKKKPGGRAGGEPPAATPTELPTELPTEEPTEPADPGEGEGGQTPPTLVPSVGPIPSIMAPLIWPFVSADDSLPVYEAMPLFLQQFLEEDADAKFGELPVAKGDETISADEAPQAPQKRSRQRHFAPEPTPEQETCDSSGEEPRGEESDHDTTKDRDGEATPECDETCAEPESPVGSSAAADGAESDDPEAPSQEKTTEEPETEESSDGSEEDKTCTEESVR